MTRQAILQHRYTWCREYVTLLSNTQLNQVWMALDADTSPTFQCIPMADWEEIVWQEMRRRGVGQTTFWRDPGAVVNAWVGTVKKTYRKKQHEQALKAIKRLSA